MVDLTFEQVKPLIEQMPSSEVERLRTWLNAPAVKQPVPESDSRTWGERLVAMVQAFDLDAVGQGWDNEDPEAWVREHRRTQANKRNPGWDEE